MIWDNFLVTFYRYFDFFHNIICIGEDIHTKHWWIVFKSKNFIKIKYGIKTFCKGSITNKQPKKFVNLNSEQSLPNLSFSSYQWNKIYVYNKVNLNKSGIQWDNDGNQICSANLSADLLVRTIYEVSHRHLSVFVFYYTTSFVDQSWM